ncbi:RWD domain-containing protein, putative [Plasmodium gallinaceum]|uniref:RWD domain-containing protein, putative n=1 Tax=Plasmodium gallinaceum TaxID=5849 RepID=A0A1J1GM40_PLAGA|nr:RWD domain-containing protein, putative [Plasmodium gallinaceum]CRG93457.1 RWD domain-containing protein, putative [Plasmodium gallinaceum]
MDYKSEQLAEKESLSLLYEHTNEFICLNNNSFKILIENKIKKISFYILFEYTEKYPDESPIYKIVESKNLSSSLKKNVENQIKETIENNLGYSMIYSIVENIRTYILEDIEEKSMYDEMIERQPKSFEEVINENADDNKKDDINYENVLEMKELCEEKYRVTEEEFNAWRKEFYKDIFDVMNNNGNLDNPTGRELFEKGKFNLLDTEYDEGEAKWSNEDLFCDIDLDV